MLLNVHLQQDLKFALSMGVDPVKAGWRCCMMVAGVLSALNSLVTMMLGSYAACLALSQY